MKNLYENYINNRGCNEGRIVLHSDLNNFFASVECKHRPDLHGFPVAVCGNKEDRHGIVLAKNELAKRCGVKTAESIGEAKKKCASLIVVRPNYDEYARYSAIVKSVYCQYSDLVEGFGMDEAWIELTGDFRIKSLHQGMIIADEIRKKVKKTTGLTVSIGVSDNKIFSKLASDYKKPDAVTLFGPENFESVISGLDVGEMLFVGKSTRKVLHTYGIDTIGDVARCESSLLKSLLGKNGLSLYADASGANMSRVRRYGYEDEAKSVGNSVTLPRDLIGFDEVKNVIYSLSEKVAYRLRCDNFVCKTVTVSIRNSSLITREMQCPIRPTSSSVEIGAVAAELYKNGFDINSNVRSVGVRASGLIGKGVPEQTDMFDNSCIRRERLSKIDRIADEIRLRYGINSISHLSAMINKISSHNATTFAHR